MRRRLLVAGILLLFGVWLITVYLRQPARTDAQLLLDARRCLAQREFAEAESFAAEVLSRTPESTAALLIAARAAVAQDGDSRALDYLRRTRDSAEEDSADAFALAGEVALNLGFAAESDAFLRKALARNSSDGASNSRLAYLLGLEGRGWESYEYLMGAVRSGAGTRDHLLMLSAVEPVVKNDELVARCLLAGPDDPVPTLGQARSALVDHDLERAERLLRRIVKAAPRLWEGQARLGALFLMRNAEMEFLDWHATLPVDARHPEIWAVRGQWARSRKELRVAARCFWETLRLDPNHRVANYQLGQSLQELGQADRAATFHARSALLEKLGFLVDRIYANPRVAELQLEAAQLTEKLGRPLEAWGWASGAAVLQPESAELQQFVARLKRRLDPDAPQTLPEADPSRSIELSDWPLPEWSLPTKSTQDVTRAQSADAPPVFVDLAEAAGIDFTYFNGRDPRIIGMRMLETNGGGVAVLDYDNDGWPDVYFTQGSHWPPGASGGTYRDAMFRNLGNDRFTEVTPVADLGDPDFSQGCAAGDFDNDGFSDLYVANVGTNRLYHNQGDGTFVKVPRVDLPAGNLWTTSCLLADLNGDGLADIYDVTYLSAADAARTLCAQGDEARSCSPGAFAAEQDQIHLNLGDGRFENVTAGSGAVVPEGKGLGIVAADFSGTGRLNLYIANDSVPSFYFVNETASRGGAIRFAERGLESGLAVNYSGLSTACMGVAAGDANGDGLIDLHVTNYADQSNTLYQQDDSGLFSDVTSQSGLTGPSYPMLGFGTQFLDGELDGYPDLVVANGHVFDLSYKGKPYRMRPQYYRNLGNARFVEVPADQLGEYFRGEFLGRGLARIDWNRDGLEDFVVSQMNSPAALVTNMTPVHGHFLAVRLVGIEGSRDAIGASVTLQSGTSSWTRQLTAGDGFQASNERKLIFGLGSAEQIDELTIRWLSGAEQTFHRLPADREILVIEGRSVTVSTP